MTGASCVAFCVGAWLAGATPGAPSSRVTIGAAEGQQSLLHRIRAELESIGYRVEIVTAELDDPARELIGLARDHASSAVIWIASDETRVEVWVEDRATGKTVRRAVSTEALGPGRDRILAHRAVELLRTSLAELERAPVPPPEAEVEAPAPARTLLRQDGAPGALGLLAGVMGSRGKLSPTAMAGLHARYMPSWRIGVAADVMFPLQRNRVTADEGSATLWTGWAIVWAHLELLRPGRRVRPFVALGAGAMLFGVRGEAGAPFSGRRQVFAAGTLAAGAGGAIALSSRVRLVGRATMGGVLPRPTLRFSGREVAEFGSPWGAGSLGMEFALP